MRARIRRRERKRKVLYITAAVVIVFVAVIAIYAATTLNGSNALIGKPVSQANYQALYRIALSGSYGPTAPSLLSSNSLKVPTGGTYYAGTRPIVVYIGAEFCPLCAFTRWPLTIALMRFGNFTGLSYMQSSPTDSDANTDTLTYYGASYTSRYLVFEPFENLGRVQQADGSYPLLQQIPSNYSGAFSTYGSNSFPFIDLANKLAVSGSFYAPTYLGSGASGNWTLDIRAIESTGGSLSTQVMTAANAYTALICNVLPANSDPAVCNNPSVTAYSSSIP